MLLVFQPVFAVGLIMLYHKLQFVTGNIWNKFSLAATYSPMPSPAQYHRPLKS